MTLRRALLRALDKPGGRSVLGLGMSYLARQHAPGAEVYFHRGMWMHRIDSRVFVDSPQIDYHPSTFRWWPNEHARREQFAKDHWFHAYQPQFGDLVLDIGAGKGEDLYTFSSAVGPAGSVLAIEAHPITFACLRLFCEINGLSNVTYFHSAIIDKTGSVSISDLETWQENRIGPGGLAASTRVPGVSLDDFIRRHNLRRIDFLKMNIEGAEALAIQGMQRALGITRALCISCHDFRAARGEGEHFRTREVVSRAVEQAGFTVVSRAADTRPYIADQVNAIRR
jgi:FkbM family methyltransferase